MNDRDLDASLRRQFQPPNLDALGDRIAAAAEAMSESMSDAAPVRLAMPMVPTAVDDAANDRRSLGLVVGVAVAAAAVLVLIMPRDPVAPQTARQDVHGSPVVALEAAPPPAVEVEVAPTDQEVAGAQLHDFLRAADFPPPAPEDCATEPEASVWRDPHGQPVLVETPELRLVWECGGETGVACADHALPAQRMMVVRLLALDADVIVCIEPPDADPHPQLPGSSEYNLFRRTLGGFVLYEVTPLDRPRVVEHLAI